MTDENKKSDDNGQEAPSGPVTIETGDRLRAENLQLKLMNLALREKNIQAELAVLRKEQSRLQTEYLQMQKDLEEKYGIDLNTSMVNSDDGTVRPKPRGTGPLS